MKFDDYTLRILAEFHLTEHGRKLLEVVNERHKEDDADLKEHPRIDNEDLRRDLRYRLGWVACLEWIANLPQKANEEQLTRQQRGG